MLICHFQVTIQKFGVELNQLELTESNQIKLKADFKHFPVDLLDSVISHHYPETTGLLRNAIGER